MSSPRLQRVDMPMLILHFTFSNSLFVSAPKCRDVVLGAAMVMVVRIFARITVNITITHACNKHAQKNNILLKVKRTRTT